jgi:hypothetical protein
MDLPYEHKPTTEMKVAALVWVLITLAVILFANPEPPKGPQAKNEARAAHVGAMFELK